MQYVSIRIEAAVPDDDRHAGHKAIVMTEAPVDAVVTALTAAGFTDVNATRDIVRRSGPRSPKAAAPDASTPAVVVPDPIAA